MAATAIDVRHLAGTTATVVAKDAGYFPVVAACGSGGSLAVVLRAGAAHIGLGGWVYEQEGGGLENCMSH
jgi:hypothetical protein